MPALYAIAQQPALHEVQAALREGEAVFAYLDDTYIVAAPERVKELYECYRAALWSHARVELNFGKTRSWNATGEEPRDIADLQQERGDAVWVGDWSLSPEQQGLVVLGAAVQAAAYTSAHKALRHPAGGRPWRTTPTPPTAKMSLEASCEAGNTGQPGLVTSARSKRTFLNFCLRLERRCCRKLGPMRRECSRSSQRGTSSPCPAHSSASSFSAGCAWRCRSAPATVPAAVR